MVIIVNRLKYKYGFKGNPPTTKKSTIQCKREASIISKTDNSPIFNQFRIMNGLMKSFYWGEIMKVQRYAEFPFRRAMPCKLEHFLYEQELLLRNPINLTSGHHHYVRPVPLHCNIDTRFQQLWMAIVYCCCSSRRHHPLQLREGGN